MKMKNKILQGYFSLVAVTGKIEYLEQWFWGIYHKVVRTPHGKKKFKSDLTGCMKGLKIGAKERTPISAAGSCRGSWPDSLEISKVIRIAVEGFRPWIAKGSGLWLTEDTRLGLTSDSEPFLAEDAGQWFVESSVFWPTGKNGVWFAKDCWFWRAVACPGLYLAEALELWLLEESRLCLAEDFGLWLVVESRLWLAESSVT